MISTERILAYGKLESEASLDTYPESAKPSHDWPSKGHIELSDLTYRHSVEGPLVLKEISATIMPTEKVSTSSYILVPGWRLHACLQIGIVGRTGAGKSSLIASLFRLAEPGGSIKIDGVECLKLGLHDLRSNISIIPQVCVHCCAVTFVDGHHNDKHRTQYYLVELCAITWTPLGSMIITTFGRH